MKANIVNGLAVKGFDVVELFMGKAVKGTTQNSAKYNEATYQFSSIGNKAKFLEEPEKYLPEYGGYCAIAMSEGSLSDPNPKSFKIQDGKLYLFTRMYWGIIDVQRQWNKDPKVKQMLADQEWRDMNLVQSIS